LVRAIQVVVNFSITRRQYNYLVWWYSRSRYRCMITKCSKRIFELRPNALSFYAIARLDEGLKKDGPLDTYLDYYPVGFKSDISPLPGRVTRLFRRRKLGKRQYAFLSDTGHVSRLLRICNVSRLWTLTRSPYHRLGPSLKTLTLW
jgi:hypothetical protein